MNRLAEQQVNLIIQNIKAKRQQWWFTSFVMLQSPPLKFGRGWNCPWENEERKYIETETGMPKMAITMKYCQMPLLALVNHNVEDCALKS